MAQTLTCPQGHQWEAAAGSPDDGTLFCPVCGTLASIPPAQGPPRSPPAPPAVPGYELEGELGRGGMGVVYRARHLKLNRVVALKMLTAGAFAGPDLLSRFQREAESLARLTHPNIVQIHEVGWVEPHGPYFTLEYVEGGSLSRQLAGLPQPPRRAAEVVAVLAGAVHFAHEHGILHRDLKPSNVLLAPDGAPKVTDFGLARFLQSEAASATDSPTPTGAVLGTPSYMAPEQAGGVTKALTAAVDVYALGAVLYEMLTGRPPFLAEGPLETTLRVMTDDPLPPRRLQPKVPRDLETICLHCLRKTPRQRYPSAAALADDLQRFLDGRPILVRPAGPGERLVKWAKRRPVVAALLAVSVLAVLAGLGVAAWYDRQLAAKNAALTKAVHETEKEKDLYDKLLVLAVDTMSEYGDAADDAVAPLPNSEQARRALLEKRLEFFAPFLNIAADNPKLQQRKARALLEVANIHFKLGDPLKAEQEYNDAIDLYETAMRGSSETPELRHGLAGACIQLGILLAGLHRGDDAATQYDRGIDLLQRLVDEGQTDSVMRRDLAAAWHDLALVRMGRRRWPEALDAFDKAVALCKRLASEDDKDDHYRVMLAGNYADRGGLYRLKGEPERGKPDVEAAQDLLRQVGPDVASQEAYRDSFAGIHYHQCLLTVKSDSTGAAAECDAAARGWNRLHQDYPTVPRYQSQAAEAFLLLGRLHYVDDRLSGAEAALRRADVLYGELVEKWKEEAEYRNGRESSRYFLALVLRKEGQFDEAATLLQGLIESAPKNADYQMEFGEIALARASGATAASQVVAGLPPVGLTVVPNPLGMSQGYIGQQISAYTEMGAARDRYRLALEHLRLAEQTGQTTLSAEQRQTVARRRFAAAQGLALAANGVRDATAMAFAGKTLADLAEAWPSLNAPNDAARTYRLAAMYTGFAVGMAGAEDRATAYTGRMLQLLHKAVEKGFRNVAELRASVEVQALLNNPQPGLRAQREDLKKLLADLEDHSQP